MKTAIDLTPAQRQQVQALLEHYLPGTTVWAFGSRVTFKARPDSDLDLVAVTTPEQKAKVSALKEAFEESDLPFRVDLLEWDEIPENFRKNIEGGEVSPLAPASSSAPSERPAGSSATPLGNCVPLSDAAEIIAGFAFKSTDFSNKTGYARAIKIADIVPPIVEVNGASFVNVNSYSKEKMNKYRLCHGDFVVAMTGATIGKVGLFRGIEESYINQRVAKFINKNGYDKKYIYYSLVNDDFYLFVKNNIDSNSAQENISATSIGRFPIIKRSIIEQKKIAAILSALDDKIALNRATNQTLEQMAQALFKSWFVDFDPVYAKARGEQPVGMDAATAALFPDSFEESELGMIPKGWEVKKLGDIAEIKIGKTPPRKEAQWFSNHPNDTKWISIKDMGMAETYIWETTETLPKEAIERFNINKIPQNAVILSFKLTVGRLAITSEEMASNEAIAHFISQILTTEYLYSFFKNFNFEELGSTSSIGTAVNSNTIRDIRLFLPPHDLILSYTEKVKQIFEYIKQIGYETLQLTQIRDSLLPKLLSGEISVADAAEQVVVP